MAISHTPRSPRAVALRSLKLLDDLELEHAVKSERAPSIPQQTVPDKQQKASALNHSPRFDEALGLGTALVFVTEEDSLAPSEGIAKRLGNVKDAWCLPAQRASLRRQIVPQSADAQIPKRIDHMEEHSARESDIDHRTVSATHDPHIQRLDERRERVARQTV